MSFKLSQEGLAFVRKELGRYEDKRSAIIPCLYKAQEENSGWINQHVIDHLVEVMDIPATQIMEVFTFYTMFNKKPVGKFHLQVCCNISCAMAGGREIVDHLVKKLGVKEGEVSTDGRVTISRVECLGSCGTAPMMQVNDKYHENLTMEKVDQLVRELR